MVSCVGVSVSSRGPTIESGEFGEFKRNSYGAEVLSHFFDGKSETSNGRVHGYIAAGFVEKIITGALHARGTKLFRVWPCRPMYFTTYCCPVCCHYGSTHCDCASSAAISKKLGKEEKEFDVCHSSTGLRNG
ncbi:unnamed protein product [Malus baccata var. baccata]